MEDRLGRIMEESAYIMEAIAGVIFLIVGVRLYRLSRQTAHLPEYFLALTFLLWALGYALYDIPYAFTEGDESIAPLFSYSSMLTFSLGNVMLALFTKDVFRKQQRWAGWLVVAIAVCLVLGSAGSAWVGDWEQVDPLANPGYWPQTVGGLAPAIWMGVEGLAHYARARKRLEIGLCAPLICHHFLLWGLAGALWAGLEIVVVVQDFIYLSAGDWSGALGIVNGLLEIVPIGMMWLVFFAPAGYRRWIEAAAPAR
jgi:putative Ca2+/H+ antiporter (TMEM165/GDT1 family)